MALSHNANTCSDTIVTSYNAELWPLSGTYCVLGREMQGEGESFLSGRQQANSSESSNDE